MADQPTAAEMLAKAEAWRAEAHRRGIKLGRLPRTAEDLRAKLQDMITEANDAAVAADIKARQHETRATALVGLREGVTPALLSLLRSLREIEKAASDGQDG